MTIAASRLSPSHAVVLAFAGAVADFALESDAQGVLQGVMGFALVGVIGRFCTQNYVKHPPEGIYARIFVR